MWALAFKCDPCDMTFTGKVPYEQHLVSLKHKKKALNSSLSKGQPVTINSVYSNKMDCEIPECGRSKTSSVKNSESPFDKDVSSNSNHTSVIDPFSQNGNKNFHCNFCDVVCTGIEPFKMHLSGMKHKKNVESRSHLLQDANVSSSNLNRQNALNVAASPTKTAAASDKITSVSPFYCTLCDKLCSGEVPYMAHLNSVKHRKKLIAAGMSDSSTSSSDTGITGFKKLSFAPGFTEDDDITDLKALNITVFYPDDVVTFDGYASIGTSSVINSSQKEALVRSPA